MRRADLWTDDGALAVNARVSIPASELVIRATRSGGPGGQHVNTSSTRVEVTWGALESAALGNEDRERLRERLASRLDSSGSIRVVAADTRSQSQNRELALQRLAKTVRDALVVPKKRRPTRPTRSSQVKRVESKKRNAERKKNRRYDGRGEA
jgi:ribosome-associated protein